MAHIRCALGKAAGWRRPSRELNTVEDFFARHADQIAKKINPPAHYPHCYSGKRMWMFTFKWPFVRTWICEAVCCCEINRICAEITEVLSSKRHGYDLYAGFSQEFGGASQEAAPAGQSKKIGGTLNNLGDKNQRLYTIDHYIL